MAQFEAREIGARIQQARNEKGLTQEELAELATFSKRSLQDYEGGTTIPYRQLREIGQLLGKPTEWFLYGEADANVTSDEMDALRGELAAARGDLATMAGQVQEVLQLLRERAEAALEERSQSG